MWIGVIPYISKLIALVFGQNIWPVTSTKSHTCATLFVDFCSLSTDIRVYLRFVFYAIKIEVGVLIVSVDLPAAARKKPSYYRNVSIVSY